MSAVMLLLLLCYLLNDHDYYKIIYCIILYIQSHNCISNIFVVISYMNHVSQ